MGDPAPQALLNAPPTVEPTQELDQNFLLLPAYDLEWEKTAAQIRVGDTLIAKLQGPELKKLPKDLKITIPAGTPSETDLGFDVADAVVAAGDELACLDHGDEGRTCFGAVARARGRFRKTGCPHESRLV